MYLVNVTDRLPPAPRPGEVIPYPVIYRPSEGGYHQGLMNGVGWTGKEWIHFGEWPDDVEGTPFEDTGTVVQWADPVAPVTLAPAITAPTVPAIEDPNATFSVQIVSFSAETKMAAIKLVRELTGLALGDSKTFVEKASVDSPPVKTGLSRSAAEALKVRLVEAGCGVVERIES